ncbi:bifunctional riboflavin kinase/FAD synthetase [Leeuwenhoekiella palythoae]|uniref:bifunctional riboflavin kinase/FAD synthetase n=1 Tax=Leeuwenhoekiella palythoae TaxID=573501 RepID=UPI000E910F88|nr:bifunctional riboflavin kinase/FAD synthetase [Leeuwenhoekiella palythoae]UBZ11686.1 bifunctional riboflavin kinase/FAD synthetase [Leeuwenhoekiella palythoae]HAX15864.1 riboflavin biosynthesis protein RibF [Leeuwenhoekiella sp.]HBO30138.1 riboflavin biosynthesis protein RibF [Leeuwenhoekiella sp.]
MKQHTSADTFDGLKGTVVTIGTFDGVHLGHRKIIDRLLASAQSNDLESVVLTFFPHPRMVLQKDTGIKLINSIDERIALLEASGLDHLIIHPFTKIFSRLTAEEFVKDILVDQLKARKVIIGYDHRFGRNRNANIEDLKAFGTQYDFEVEEISKQDVDDVAVSSTKIRKALNEGDLTKANEYLGYPFMLNGIVSRGKGLGKKFNYPTANLKIKETYKLIPAKGVYVARASINGKEVYGMMSIGTNPTVGGSDLTIETFFFDFDADLYDQHLQIELLTRIRDEKKFNSVDELIAAMQADERFSRDFIQKIDA